MSGVAVFDFPTKPGTDTRDRGGCYCSVQVEGVVLCFDVDVGKWITCYPGRLELRFVKEVVYDFRDDAIDSWKVRGQLNETW